MRFTKSLNPTYTYSGTDTAIPARRSAVAGALSRSSKRFSSFFVETNLCHPCYQHNLIA